MAEASVKNEKISLKMIVDSKSNKVVFAEAGNDFVDLIFSLMSLPLCSVAKLLNDKGMMVGSLGSLHKTIESFDSKYFLPNFKKDSVVFGPPTTIKLYRCSSHANNVSYFKGSVCPTCKTNGYSSKMMLDTLTYLPPRIDGHAGFVNDVVRYIVMDNLEVHPMSISLITSLVKNFTTVKEKIVDFGLDEGLSLLKASFETQAVLTSVFHGNKVVKNGKH